MSLTPASRPPPFPSRALRDLAVCVAALLALLAWDASGLDLVLVRAYGDASGFAWRDHWLTRGVLHEGGRALGWAVFAALLWNLWRPLPPARALSRRERWWWFGTTLACLLIAPSLKQWSLTSCPWSLAEFGGAARHVSHWALGVRDGGPGGCFPSGHAAAAFGFFAGWFALRERAPRAARAWLAAVLLLGTAYGWGQMARGAHYASHTLWTGWICFVLSAASWHALRRWREGAPASPAH